MIHEVHAYNGDYYVSHFQDLHTRYSFVHCHAFKSNIYDIFTSVFKVIRNVYKYTPSIVRLDGEQTFRERFKHNFIEELGMIQMRAATMLDFMKEYVTVFFEWEF